MADLITTWLTNHAAKRRQQAQLATDRELATHRLANDRELADQRARDDERLAQQRAHA